MSGPNPQDDLLAVLTGDIVRSSALTADELGAVMTAVRTGTETFGALYPGSVIGEADIFRGDSWQVAMASPGLSLRLAVYLRAGVVAGGLTDTRVSIGIGSENAVSADRISQSTGKAFLSSGRGLDDIGGRQMTLAMPDAQSDTQALAAGLVLLLDHLVTSWTVKQAGAVRDMLENPGKPDADIANARLSDSDRRNFAKLRNRAHASLLLDVLDAFEGLTCWSGS